jgi:hypothetical protein
VRIAILAVFLVLAAATVYEALVALRIIDLGSLPGEGPPGAEVVGVVAAVALVAAALLSALLFRMREAPVLSAFLAPDAGAFLLARFYAFDPYYLPTLIRYADRDFVPPGVVFALAGLALAAGALTLTRRRAGLVLSVQAILACALTAWFSGLGH